MENKIFVIGGGASGLYAAIHAAKNGAKVIVLEANNQPCKKILVTGNGRCNLTNEKVSTKNYNCKNPDFIEHVLQQYTNDDTLQTFASFGIITKNKNGYYYPNSMQAQTISDVLIRICKLYNIKIYTDITIGDIRYNEKNHTYNITAIKSIYDEKSSAKSKKKQLISKETVQYSASKIIIACGSNAGLKTTDTDAIIDSVKQMQHTVINRTPALCSLYVNQEQDEIKYFFKNATGIRTEIKAKTKINNEIVSESNGELQITEYGLSGIVIFQLSSLIGEKILYNKQISVIIDFLPDHSIDEILEFMQENEYYQKITVVDFLSGFINNKLAINLIHLYEQVSHVKIDAQLMNLNKNTLNKLLEFIKNCTFSIKKTNDLLHAQVSHGGVSTSEINSKTMESLKCKGLYFAGEIIDVDGMCGGYNLQFAWSTGAIAGRNAAND